MRIPGRHFGAFMGEQSLQGIQINLPATCQAAGVVMPKAVQGAEALGKLRLMGQCIYDLCKAFTACIGFSVAGE